MDILQHGGCIFICGSLGGGKTLGGARLMRMFLARGRRVATNLDINLLSMTADKRNQDNDVYRLPDYPESNDFMAIGYGTDTLKDRSTHGLILLDECGIWLNSRNAMDKTVKAKRLDIIEMFLTIRHRGWSIAFIVQDFELVDKQIRRTMMQFRIDMKNLQHMPVPLLGLVCRLFFGFVWTMPAGHLGTVRYIPNKDQLVDWWMFKGTDLYGAYDTEQEYSRDHINGNFQYLTNWYTTGRYLPEPLTRKEKFMKILIRWNRDFILAIGVLIGMSVSAATIPKPVQIIVARNDTEQNEPVKKEQVPKETPEMGLDAYHIDGHFKFGHDPYLVLFNDEKRTTTRRLVKMGFFINIHDECHVTVDDPTRGNRYEIFCKSSDPDDDDGSHLPAF